MREKRHEEQQYGDGEIVSEPGQDGPADVEDSNRTNESAADEAKPDYDTRDGQKPNRADEAGQPRITGTGEYHGRAPRRSPGVCSAAAADHVDQRDDEPVYRHGYEYVRPRQRNGQGNGAAVGRSATGKAQRHRQPRKGRCSRTGAGEKASRGEQPRRPSVIFYLSLIFTPQSDAVIQYSSGVRIRCVR